MIMSGEMEAGSKVKESVIASAMGVSRNTVREAVRLLEQGGLVRHEMYRGTVVIDPSADELRELYAARMALEVAAVRVVIDGPDLAHLEGEFEQLKELTQAQPALSLADRVAQDLAFHAAIVATLKSKRIDDLYSQVAKELRFYLMVLTDEESVPDFVHEHERIMRSIAEGDVPGAIREVAEHLEVNAQRAEELLSKRRRPSP